MKTLIAKELRENAKWLLTGLAIMLVLTWMALPKNLYEPQNKLMEYLGTAAALFAMFLGFVQSIFDYSDRQRGFLFHRAVSSRDVVLSKLVSGLVIYATVVAIPLAFAAGYFAVMGLRYLPVRPMQIVPALFLLVICYWLHPAAMLVIKRPAKWYGTKLLPLVLPGLISYVYYFCSNNSWPAWALFVFFSALLLVHTIGFTNLAFNNVFSTLAALTIVCGAIIFGMSTIDSYARSSGAYDPTGYITQEYGIDGEGNIWHVRVRKGLDRFNKETKTYVSGSPILPNQSVNLDGQLPKDFSIKPVSNRTDIRQSYKPYGQITSLGGEYRYSYFWDERGYMLRYSDETRMMQGSISKDGFSPGEQLSGTPFSENPRYLLFSALSQVGIDSSRSRSSLLVPWMMIGDTNGFYLLNYLSDELKVVLDQSISAVIPLYRGKEIEDEFLIETADSLIRFRLDFRSADPDPSKRSDDNFELRQVATYPKFASEALSYWIVGISGERITALGIGEGTEGQIATLNTNAPTQWEVKDVRLKPLTTMEPWTIAISSLFPFVAVVAGALVRAYYDGISPLAAIEYLPTYALYVSLASIVLFSSLGLTAFLLRSRSTDRQSLILWLLLCIPLGLAAPLAVSIIYPKLTFERCTKCDRKRRVDRNKCEYCSSVWEPLPSQGIEILESQRFQNLASVE